MIKKNLKPIDQDIHLKYVCPNNKCSYFHWLSLQETQTSGFKVVCSCGQIFYPKKISRAKIVYKKIRVIEKTITEKTKDSLDFEEKCARVLESYGFSKSECKRLIANAQTTNQFDTSSSLLKHILLNLNLSNFGENND